MQLLPESAVASCVAASFFAGLAALALRMQHHDFAFSTVILTLIFSWWAAAHGVMHVHHNRGSMKFAAACMAQGVFGLALFVAFLVIWEDPAVVWVAVATSALEALAAVDVLAMRSQETRVTWVTPEVARARAQMHEAFGIDVTEADAALVLNGWYLVATSDAPLHEKKLVKFKLCRTRAEAKEAVAGRSLVSNTGVVVDAALLRGERLVTLV